MVARFWCEVTDSGPAAGGEPRSLAAGETDQAAAQSPPGDQTPDRRQP